MKTPTQNVFNPVQYHKVIQHFSHDELKEKYCFRLRVNTIN